MAGFFEQLRAQQQPYDRQTQGVPMGQELNQPYVTAGGAGASPSDADFAKQIEAQVRASYGGAPVDENHVREQVQYYLGKRKSGETSGWATGEPGRTMDDYWKMRAGYSAFGGYDDPATGGPLAGTSAINGGGLPPGFSTNPGSAVSSFQAPGLLAPYNQEFTGVDPRRISESPGYQFRMQEGMKALENSAAARGTLLTGGTLKDLTGYAQGLASTEYDNEWNRAYQGAGFNRDTFWGNQNNAFSKLDATAGRGLQAASSYAPGVAGMQTAGANAQAGTATANNNNLNSLFGNLAEVGTALINKRKAKTSAA